jgi:hypothetical protein
LFDPEEDDASTGQLSFFSPGTAKGSAAGKEVDQAEKAAPSDVAVAEPTRKEAKRIEDSAAQAMPLFELSPLADPSAAIADSAAHPVGDSASAQRPVEEVSLSQFLAGLNPEQQAAVLSTASCLIIVAGPGTGKTRTLTYRIARLIDQKGIAPNTILAITFTN